MKLDKAQQLAHSLMEEHNVSGEWDFCFGNFVMKFGECREGYRRGVSYKEIALSKRLTEVMTESHVSNTSLHEIAHAIVGIEQHHSKEWRAKFIEIGGNGEVEGGDLEIASLVTNYSYRCIEGNHIAMVSEKRKAVLNLECTLHSGSGVERYRNTGQKLVLDSTLVKES